MNIAITGATGLLGRSIAERLRASGGVVRAVSVRTPPRPEDLDGCRAVIHLAGEPVAQRWTASVRDRILASRVEGTRGLVQALSSLAQPPEVLISASAVGYYGSRGDEMLRESAAPADDFLARVCVEWEREALVAEKLGVRVVRLRIAMVLAREGGALQRMLLPFRLGTGGKIGDGAQWMSWIHIEDLISLIRFALVTPELRGALNASAPNPVTNVEFTRVLSRALHRPAIFPVPRFALKLLYGEMAGMVFATIEAALTDLL
jgi:uncharacterized protein